MIAVKCLAKKHVFIAIMAQTLVERMLEHDVATYQQIGRVEMLVGSLLALMGCVMWLFGFLVAIAQQLLLFGRFCEDSNAAVNHHCW